MEDLNIRLPRARAKGLIVRKLDDETIVYDLETNQAHCLNSTSTIVWQHCDGQTTVTVMVTILQEAGLGPVAEDAVWQVLSRLGEYDLLEEQVSRPVHGSMSRREWMKRTGLTAAVALPLITSLAVPSAAMAASTCTGAGGNGCACTSGLQCSSGCCRNGACQPLNGKLPYGGTCTGNGNCCSNICQITAGKMTGTCQ